MYNGRISSLGIFKIYLLSGLIRCKECDYTAVPGSNFKNHNAVKHESRNKNVNNAIEKGTIWSISRNPTKYNIKISYKFQNLKCLVFSKKYIRKWKTCFPPLNKDRVFFYI